MKTCGVCGETKALEDFPKQPRHKADGRGRNCKVCVNTQRKIRRADPVKRARELEKEREGRKRRYSPEANRANSLMRRYLLSVDEYDEMLEAQGGVCAICETSVPGGHGRFHVDHDHTCCPGVRTCGKCIRALLCSTCNVMLGAARENVTTLARAITYLTK